MKKLMMGMVACVAMTLFGAQNEYPPNEVSREAGAVRGVSLKIAETYRGKTTHVIDCGRLAMGRQSTTGGFLEAKKAK